MQRKPLIAALLAAAFAFPLAATAASNQPTGATPSPGPSTATAGNDGGAEAMFKSMDKNGDGFITKDEAEGSPHAAQFDQLDTNHDGKLSRAEHAAAPEHAAARSNASANKSSSSSAGDKKTY